MPRPGGEEDGGGVAFDEAAGRAEHVAERLDRFGAVGEVVHDHGVHAADEAADELVVRGERAVAGGSVEELTVAIDVGEGQENPSRNSRSRWRHA